MNPELDSFFKSARYWGKEMQQLRSIVLECELAEEVKWNVPVYTVQGKNVLAIGELKDHCVLSFFKGALLQDASGLLEKPGENTQSARVIPFTNVKDIIKLKETLKAYIYEAIEVENVGLKVVSQKPTDMEIPEELEAKFEKSAKFKKAFFSLTPGRQRAYILHFSQPKQSKTREARIEKYADQIIAGIGLNDEYQAKRKN